ncbi:N-acetylmuramoyl-L-alanine amidase [Mycolicibacterium elephantis]|uniref:peptidoglycan recognition protein family protein n=1 Tax=Mycolicibacterium elephantis TaxID=81858 RepID=UPI00062967DE|nr:peptidoglycan-binding domain-containing protein [Mycolicibacterium elephantis]KKW65547.1 N-acetylmuramoyl-L-alanine amidase [Mycolicibacterium elephantis]
MPQTTPWTGDPVWLADVLRAEGIDPVEFPGWRSRGHGDFKDIRGVMVHHTGSDNASAASIAYGHPGLRGPLSQLHIARDGTVSIVAVGVAWHAGRGMYPWVPTNMGNWHLIGIECANSGTSSTAPHRHNWPDAQYFALVRCCAAINRRLSQTSARTIGHKEYAGRAQGKWDPGAIDMDILRRDIQERIGDISRLAPTPSPPVPIGEYADVLLFRGTEGPEVADLQRLLKSAYPEFAGHLAVDGDFGPQTEAAVRDFQRRTPGLEVDGIVGPATAAALRLNLARTATATIA